MVRLFLRELTAIPFVKIYAKSKKAESAVSFQKEYKNKVLHVKRR